MTGPREAAAPALLERGDRLGVPAFDLVGPLPTGTTVLEASAGTGKTHTIAALVTRYVAEGVAALDDLLVVTFSRSASQELRERVREHLVRASRALADPATARHDEDEVIRHLATPPPGSPDEVSARHRRLLTARADFDAATIVTTHGFCQLVLASLGVAGDSDAGVELVEDLSDLVGEVVDDLYLQGFAGRHAGDGAPFLDPDQAARLGRQVVEDPQAELAPADAQPGSVAYRRVRFAAAVRAEVQRRKRRRRVLGFDDLLVRLAAALRDSEAPALARMRRRWSTVLVDEFQDTDPVQWEILSQAFADVATLVLVGDPKQAIYAFRGGDIHTYLRATAAATAHATLDVNRRSDAPLVDALQVLLGGLELGDPRIPVRPVSAAERGSRLTGAPVSAPVRLRVLDARRHDTARGKIRIGPVRPFIARDLAADIAELLGSDACWDGRPLQAGDVAVLVSRHAQAEQVRQALAAKGIAAVVAGPSNVYTAPAGTDWLTLLEALEQPHRSGRARAAALTPFVGHTAAELNAGGEALTDSLSALFARWAELLAERGVAALMEVAEIDRGMPARVLATPDGERRMTDLRHVGEALHTAAITDGLGVGALAEWLRHRRRERPGGTADERVRRLETDAAAVQVLTVHASKGLQFPVVYLPFAFDRWVSEENVDPVRYHDPDSGQRTVDVGGPGSPGRADRVAAALAEDAAESLRLLYVGLTRARSQVVLWWGPTTTTECSPLHRVLFGRRPESGSVSDRVPVRSSDESGQLLLRIQRAGGLMVEEASISAIAAAPRQDDSDDVLAVATLTRSPGAGWRRLSYTSLSSAAAAGPEPTGVGSEPETGQREDEALPVTAVVAPLVTGGDPDVPGLAPSPASTDVPLPLSPMGQLPVGAAFGTLTHAVLELADPQAPDLAAELLHRCREEVPRHAQPLDPDALAAALLPVLRTPLGPLAGDRTLADIGRRDRLAELTFEMPLCGGDLAAGGAGQVGTLGEVAGLLRAHLPASDPLAGYADRLADPGLAHQPLWGYLTGSLDVVLRVDDGSGPRYLVADYKTNWLGDLDSAPGSGLGAPPDVRAYRPAGLAAAMAGSDYPLQALLYGVALHRFLRWRQPGYDPAVHLGGVLYLFVRGMCGPQTPVENGQPFGVFGWKPPAGLITDLSDLLGGGR
ncbi:UvrD-helicase domain-containing protein [Nakamurella flava]|uniref:UvrD-helicase domain-containing protein n=1 Tax=Nakamurella flava TaxID=2576308 RepID=UPI001F0DB5D0|nr:UvrD-helicase domain-containing protein [Nakamurella flava]